MADCGKEAKENRKERDDESVMTENFPPCQMASTDPDSSEGWRKSPGMKENPASGTSLQENPLCKSTCKLKYPDEENRLCFRVLRNSMEIAAFGQPGKSREGAGKHSQMKKAFDDNNRGI